MKYQAKPIEIEAFQYDGDFKGTDGTYYVPDWAIEAIEKRVMYFRCLRFEEPPSELYIDTSIGTLHVSVGDYIIHSINGEIYPCKPDLFEKIYELI